MAEISIKKATAYNAAAKYGQMFIQLGLTMLLSRLILPEAFGVIAITTILLGFLNLFADMGLGISVIQYPDLEKKDLNGLFSFSLIVGVVLGVITALASFPLAVFYEEPLYYTLCPILSIISFFQSANVVPNAILTRDKQFKTIAVRTILCSLVSGVIAVVLARLGFGVYALVAQSVISQIFLFIWNYLYAPLSLCRFRLRNVAKLLGSYSLFQVLFNFLNYFTRNLDHIIIGKSFGSEELAQYNKSYSLYLYPNNIFAAVLTGVIHPYVRDYKNNHRQMFSIYMRIEKILSLIGIISMMVFFFCSQEMVLIMFGKNWVNAGVYLKCLSLCMWTQMMCSVSGSFFLGLERTEQTFKCGIINLVLLIMSIVIGIWFKSMVVLSLCVSLSYNIIFIITNYILVKRTMGIGLSEFLQPLKYDAVFVFAFVALAYFIPEITTNLFVSLMVKLVICVAAYSLYLTVSRQWGMVQTLKGMITKK